ncbi:hypothetical protein CC85DRAFT_299147 [Cutaneotrichosporon oleaginosum]|uniref:GCN5-related N-acetyltransferase Rv2170-like domain-containing protein n=1 Tax=Cutaneotrichosporon oleaginosum TaxID=879819 RepID=A0A0J0XY44_9TREE|nr:uncharacterized protein CC85DRAFT_299147 [Cutaneotrichosporon oleaginosum]KLT45972.1 hypothetical protein CC85DRAFT_299147 [Cutaneotrichosporon oleaginosum]TXT06667.1 hypothetical protein COLE_05998 [Cutaneotrichosporon oleaginosum]
MTNTSTPLTLYPHSPASLVPLLSSQLPYTLVLLATIQANRHAESDPSPVSAPDCQVPPPLPPVYATFPPPTSGAPSLAYLESLDIGPYDWLVAVALPPPSEQIRFYHALVASSFPSPKEARRAEETVEAALRFMRWEPIARGVLGGKTQVPTYIYIAPEGGFGHTDIRNVPSSESWDDDLVLDHGRESDKDLIFSVNHYRKLEYYGARAAHITVLRPRGPGVPPPEVFVQCHGDGSLGTLHTQPAFRRRGLAKVVLNAHFKRYEGTVPQYCYIEPDNVASIALFEGLGWTRLPWATYWVFERSVQE